MDWLAMLIAIAGVVFNIRKRREGFALWLFSNAYWAARNFGLGEYAQMILFIVFFGLSGYGFFAWRPEKKPTDRPHRVAKPLSQLVYQGTIKDRDTIHELKKRFKANNLVTERLLFKLRYTRPGPTRLRTTKK